MKLTIKFSTEAKKLTSNLFLWSSMSADDSMLSKIHREAANVEHCAHVADFHAMHAGKIFGWCMEAIRGLQKLNLYR